MAKRLSSSSINWAKLVEILDKRGLSEIHTLKLKSDKFLREVMSHPAELPKLDWAYYKSKIALPGMVDAMKNGYETVKIPYPGDQGYFAKIDKQLQELKNDHKADMAEMSKSLAELEAKLKKMEAIPPYSQMNNEQFTESGSPYAIIESRPDLWPVGAPRDIKEKEHH
ncbi:hypothetical protein RUM44_004830 [Polyplax serrata]|uniref:ATP synthase subunit d, mitochondrial n=1 Tax=Polyplax serrata TaxID=468196 RepID=A0ABR1B3Y5_POLSC